MRKTGTDQGAPREPDRPPRKPRPRGVSHQYAFPLALALAGILVFEGHRALTHLAAAIFAASVAAMFGASALYHRVTWTPARRAWIRRLDHTMLYGLIAGTYTPFGLLVLSGEWRIVVLAIALVIVAVACHYASIAFFVLPRY